MAVAKGPDRDAGRETLFMPDREAIKLEPRDPVLYFIQRLRDEAHRFVIGSHRKLRKKDIREAGLQEIPGIGPSRKRALLHHFGTLKEIERASIADLGKVPGVSAESARKIFEFFHAAIENAVRLAPTSPGVYRMLNAASDVLYVGKAKNVRKRLASYARVNAPLPARILRMIAATVTVEIVSTTTETEALLLEANLIKQLRPRFNVQLRDDKSFPYILIIRRSLGAADSQASRRAKQARPVFRAVRIRRRRQPHHHGAAARLFDPLLHRRFF